MMTMLATPAPAMADGPSRPIHIMSTIWLVANSPSMTTIGQESSTSVPAIGPSVQFRTAAGVRSPGFFVLKGAFLPGTSRRREKNAGIPAPLGAAGYPILLER